MKDIKIRDAILEDFPTILKLNDAEVEKTSPMDLERLSFLDKLSCYHKVVTVDNEVAGFLLVMKSGADYKNDNFSWFAAKFEKFFYIDRIVVGSDFFGLTIGTMLYNDLIEHAKANGIKTISCEYNIKPMNTVSQAFHNKFGFKEMGTQEVADGTKLVSLQILEI